MFKYLQSILSRQISIAHFSCDTNPDYTVAINHFKKIDALSGYFERYQKETYTHAEFLSVAYQILMSLLMLIKDEMLKQNQADLSNLKLLAKKEGVVLPDVNSYIFSSDNTAAIEHNRAEMFELSEGMDLKKYFFDLLKAQELLFAGNYEGVEIIKSAEPFFKQLAVKISEGGLLAALVPDNEYPAFAEAMQIFIKTFATLVDKTSEIYTDAIKNAGVSR